MADKLAETINYLIGLAGVSFVLLILYQKSKNQPNFKVYGLDIKTILRIGAIAIILFVVLLTKSLV
ncbi:MAG: hypothetical protein H7122_13395 [Chitinophagaceae bacterium]|nr:hypothetical protein [Chitinophagaceae bacterium]